jgi:hypothetical protein
VSGLEFKGDSGRKPQAEARRYVYRVISMILDYELTDSDGWMFGGIEKEPDQSRLRKAIKAVRVEMLRKAAK